MHSDRRFNTERHDSLGKKAPWHIDNIYDDEKLLPEPKDANEFCENWMSHLDDDLPVSSLTIPGTHDSAAYTSIWPFVATQRMNIRQQVDAGVRYLDLRCAVRDDVVEMVHGRSYLGIRLSEVLEELYTWLNDHRKEGLILQIKKDRSSQRATVDFAQAIYRLLSAKPERWRTANTTPTLSELRGKIQLFRRYRGPRAFAFGISVTRWKDNPSVPFTIKTYNNVRITIQDHYNFSKPTTLPEALNIKADDVTQLLDRASQDQTAAHWYINFASAFELNYLYQLPPVEIALGGYWAFKWHEGINVRLQDWVDGCKGKARLGIVAMDFPEAGAENLILTLVKTNFAERSDQKWKTLFKCLLAILLIAFVVANYDRRLL